MQAVFFGAFHQAVDDGACVRSRGSKGKEPVLPTDDEGFDAALAPIVVQFQASILQEDDEFVPLVQAIADRLSERAFRECRQGLVVQPGAEGVEHRTTLLQASVLALLGRGVVERAFDGEEFIAERQPFFRPRGLRRRVTRRRRQGLQRVGEAATGMRPAADQRDARQLFVRLIAVDVQIALKAV